MHAEQWAWRRWLKWTPVFGQQVLTMIRLSLTTLSIFISLLFGSCSQGQDDASEKRLHFILVQDKESAKLLPVDQSIPIAEGETRVSCRAVEFCMKYNKPRTILVGCRIEHTDSWLESDRIEAEFGPDGFKFSHAGLQRHFRTPEAEEKFKEKLRRENMQLHTQRLRDSIDRGMIESEKEHHKIVLEQLRRTFITGQRQITKP